MTTLLAAKQAELARLQERMRLSDDPDEREEIGQQMLEVSKDIRLLRDE